MKNPRTTLVGLVLAAAGYIAGHPAEFGDAVVQIAGIAGPLASFLIGALAKDAHAKDEPAPPAANTEPK